MKNFMKLLAEYKEVTFSVVVILALSLGWIFLPIVGSALAVFGLLVIVILAGYSIYEGVRGIKDRDLPESLRDYKESSRSYDYFKIYIFDLLMVIIYGFLVILVVSSVVMVIYSLIISPNLRELFEWIRLPFSAVGFFVTILISIFLKERKNL